MTTQIIQPPPGIMGYRCRGGRVWLVLAWAAAVAFPQESYSLECSGLPFFGQGSVFIAQRLPANHCRRSARAADERGGNDPIIPAWAPPRPAAGAPSAAAAAINPPPATTIPSPTGDGVDGNDAEVAVYNRPRRQDLDLVCCQCRACCNCV